MVTTALVFAARSGSNPAARSSTRDFFQKVLLSCIVAVRRQCDLLSAARLWNRVNDPAPCASADRRFGMKSENDNKADSPFRSVLQAMPADFWRLWFVGMIVSTVRWLETVVVGVVVYQQTGSAFVVAMMTMLRLLPMGLFGAFLGAFVERFDRRLTLAAVLA